MLSSIDRTPITGGIASAPPQGRGYSRSNRRMKMHSGARALWETTGDLREPADRTADKASFRPHAWVFTGDLPELASLVADVAGLVPDHSANRATGSSYV